MKKILCSFAVIVALACSSGVMAQNTTQKQEPAKCCTTKKADDAKCCDSKKEKEAKCCDSSKSKASTKKK